MDWESIYQKQALKIVQEHWTSIAGDFLSQRSYPVEIKKSTLLVQAEHSLIAQEIEFQKSDWIQTIQTLNLPFPIQNIVSRSGTLRRNS